MDLLCNKLEADRPKNRDFFQEAIICKLADLNALIKFVPDFAPNTEARETLLGNLGDIVKGSGL